MHPHSVCFFCGFVFLLLPPAHAQDLQGKLDRQMCVYKQLHGAGNLVLTELKEHRINTLSIHALQDQVILVCFLVYLCVFGSKRLGPFVCTFCCTRCMLYAVTINAFDVSLLVLSQAARSQRGLEALHGLHHDDLLIFSGVDAITFSSPFFCLSRLSHSMSETISLFVSILSSQTGSRRTSSRRSLMSHCS